MKRDALIKKCSNRSRHADGCEGQAVLTERRKNNGTKFWPASFNDQMLWQTDFYAGMVAPEGCDRHSYDAFCKVNRHEGEYVELQNGPGASQRHSFPVDGRSTYEVSTVHNPALDWSISTRTLPLPIISAVFSAC